MKNGRSHKPLWITLGAAACLCIAGGAFFLNSAAGVKAGAEAVYPKMAQYPNESSLTFDQDYDKWWKDRRTQLDQPEGYSDNLWNYYMSSTFTFLSEEQNSAFSPVNLYMALSALSETCDGDSRRQILSLLDADSVESLRTQAAQLWNANYCNDGALTSVLANSVWLSDGVKFDESTIDSLAKNYYASGYSVKFGTESADKAIQNWLNSQTGGFLKEAVSNVRTDPAEIFALYSTVYFRAKWDDEFNKNLNTEETFHAPSGDIERTFMHKTLTYGPYYFGENYAAVQLSFKTGCDMWLILPDRFRTITDVLNSSEYMDMIRDPSGFDNSKSVQVELSLPKFDISSSYDLREGLSALGVTDIFDPEKADFSPMCSDPAFVGSANTSVRVAVDEEGCTAASFVEIAACGAAMPPEDIVELNFDRPFIFVVTGMDGQPLFTGTVCEP